LTRQYSKMELPTNRAAGKGLVLGIQNVVSLIHFEHRQSTQATFLADSGLLEAVF
jgi:hypothetical protein